MIKGQTIYLYEKIEKGLDALRNPIYEFEKIPVENVLVGSPTTQELIDTINLTGRKAVYQLAIPKGDNHNWENATVEFFGEKWHTFGIPTQGIDELIPGPWNTKVMVERYE